MNRAISVTDNVTRGHFGVEDKHGEVPNNLVPLRKGLHSFFYKIYVIRRKENVEVENIVSR